jgi:ABC-type sugar transport system ATPase subunit
VDAQNQPVNALLEMRGIRKAFAGGEVLHGVDFTLEQGQIHALVGQNGAGKSTLMKVLGGVYPDYSGEIRIEGRAVHPHSPHAALAEGIAVIYQDFALVPDMSVADNISLGREPAGPLPGMVSHRAMAARSARDASDFGIELPMDRRVGDLSVGDQQLTEIVKALSRRARVLVMDEPTARLSPNERTRLFEIMRMLAGQGVGIVYISHFLEEVFAVTDKVTVLRDGDVVASQPTSTLDMSSLTRLLVGTALSGAKRQRTLDAARGPGLELIDFSVSGREPVNITVHAGEILGIAGLVGSGRSRLVKGIAGAHRSGGTVKVRGVACHFDTPEEAARGGVLYLPEDRKAEGLVLTLNVGENLVLSALGRGMSRLGLVRRKACDETGLSLIDRFRIVPADPKRLVKTLSGGNQQKTLLARACAAEADVVLLDQPTAGVDVGAKAEIYEQIWNMADSGTAIVVVSDDLDELLRLSDRIMVMQKGRVTRLEEASKYSRHELLEAITAVQAGTAA